MGIAEKAVEVFSTKKDFDWERLDEALKLLNLMKERGQCPDVITYNALLNGFCKFGRVDEAYGLLETFEKDVYDLGLHGYCCLIDGSFRAKRYAEAMAWFRKMEQELELDVVLYTIIIRGLSDAGRVKEALNLFYEMTERNLVPDTYCYNALIKGFCDLGLLDKAQSLRLEISKNGCFPDACTYTILICGMCRNGLVGEEKQIFKEMKIGEGWLCSFYRNLQCSY